MPSPLSRKHGSADSFAAGWLCVYHAETPGTDVGSNATTMMGGDGAIVLAFTLLAVVWQWRRSRKGETATEVAPAAPT